MKKISITYLDRFKRSVSDKWLEERGLIKTTRDKLTSDSFTSMSVYQYDGNGGVFWIAHYTFHDDIEENFITEFLLRFS